MFTFNKGIVFTFNKGIVTPVLSVLIGPVLLILLVVGIVACPLHGSAVAHENFLEQAILLRKQADAGL